MNRKTKRILCIFSFLMIGVVLTSIGGNFNDLLTMVIGIFILNTGITLYCLHFHLIKYHEKGGLKMSEEEPEEKEEEKEEE